MLCARCVGGSEWGQARVFEEREERAVVVDQIRDVAKAVARQWGADVAGLVGAGGAKPGGGGGLGFTASPLVRAWGPGLGPGLGAWVGAWIGAWLPGLGLRAGACGYMGRDARAARLAAQAVQTER